MPEVASMSEIDPMAPSDSHNGNNNNQNAIMTAENHLEAMYISFIPDSPINPAHSPGTSAESQRNFESTPLTKHYYKL